MLQIFLATLGSFCFTFLSVYFLIQFLRKHKFYQKVPSRPFQRKFIPELGGLGFGYSLFLNLFIFGSIAQLEELVMVGTCILFVFALGIGDDNLLIRPRVKFAVMLLIAGIFVQGTGFRISTFHGFLGIEMLPDWFSYGFTIFFITALTHGFNLSDGVDGLASTLALIALGFLGGWFYVVDQISFSLLSFTMFGGLLAFLKFNWFPAKIFMGDTGSLTLGFTIAILLLVFFSTNENLSFSNSGKIRASFSMGLMLVAYPVLDTSRVFIRRILKKKNPFRADGTHIHHFLLKFRLSQRDVTKLICFTQLFLVLITYQVSNLDDNLLIPILLILEIIFLIGIEVYIFNLNALRAKLKRQVQLES